MSKGNPVKQLDEALRQTRDLWGQSTTRVRFFLVFLWLVTAVSIAVGFAVVLVWKLVTSWRFWVGVGAAALVWMAYTFAQIH